MTMGLPHSSQSMSVAMLCAPLPLLMTGFSPVILAIISAERWAPSLRRGTRASTCLRWSASSLLRPFMPRHLGKLAHPSHGPRLPSRRSSTPPSFSHLIVVGMGGGLGGSGLPSLSKLMIVEQEGSPFSFFSEYPLHPRNSPNRPRRLIKSRPQFG